MQSLFCVDCMRHWWLSSFFDKNQDSDFEKKDGAVLLCDSRWADQKPCKSNKVY